MLYGVLFSDLLQGMIHLHPPPRDFQTRTTADGACSTHIAVLVLVRVAILKTDPTLISSIVQKLL